MRLCVEWPKKPTHQDAHNNKEQPAYCYQLVIAVVIVVVICIIKE
jgi:hypothetical protein